MIEEPAQPETGTIPWTPEALARLDKIPAFVRPMARKGIEQFARENGLTQVDEAVLEQVKDRFGM
ncbi:MAG: protochlorophyllide oxidoreductase [Calditrichaeota bacterium]|nr:MAG: protochlorophyllide oxidoreductase [Calditrichota bacterium]